MHGCVRRCAYAFVASEHHAFANKANTLYYKTLVVVWKNSKLGWEQMPYTLSLHSCFYNTILLLKYKISGILRLAGLIKNYMGAKPLLYYTGAKTFLYFLVYVKLKNIAIFLN